MSSWEEEAIQLLLQEEEEDDKLFFGLALAFAQDHSGKKRKQSQVAAVLNDYLNHKKAQSEKTVGALLEKEVREEEYSVEKCLDTVNGMNELTDEDKAIATDVFENDINREMFMKQKNLNVRLLWLRRKIHKIASS